jgi:hypothetical protein
VALSTGIPLIRVRQSTPFKMGSEAGACAFATSVRRLLSVFESGLMARALPIADSIFAAPYSRDQS